MASLPASLVADLSRLKDLRLSVNEPLSLHTSFGLGGPADLYIEPQTPSALAEVIRIVSAADCPLLVLGRGTNVLVSDEGVRGAVVATHPGLNRIEVHGQRIVAAAGVLLSRLCHVAADAGLSGLEELAGIPGTVGGALCMNAGANGSAISDCLETIAVLDAEGTALSLRREELTFGYRHASISENNWCVVEGTFTLTPSSPAAVHERVYEVLERRCRTQPVGARSAGSIFKRPPGDYAGRLLEAVGAKGLRIGGAQISPKHANFIINCGDARAADVLQLIRESQRRVYERFGILLEPEIRIVGVGVEEFIASAPGAAGVQPEGAL
ncbi:MAG: UDP-N-acetylmuramate dehydrogenase [Armatimonadetes bacterium]|nr:UDP-N-acetylmuramate dehydrogenase [Armatimonadota bacterium]